MTRLARRLGTADAVAIGLGSMIGAGVFAAIGPAARAAGGAMLVGLAVAAIVAFCNATSSAQLAAVYPRSGGTYVYGRERLGPFWGYLAGWGFVVGKVASCAAMALTFGAYAWPDGARPLAVAAVVAVTAVNLLGIERTALATRAMLAVVLLSLAVAVLAALLGGHASADRLSLDTSDGLYGVLQAAGLLFFAFAGYARIATLGEEVRDPRRTIPRAVPIALGVALVVYAAVAVSVLAVLGPAGVASSDAPLADAARSGSLHALAPLVRVGAVVGSLGVLLSLLAGVSRTVRAMARDRELPGQLATVEARHQVPARAEVAVAVAVVVLAATLDLRGAIGFSSFAVLVYYLIANVAAWTLPRPKRRWPRALSGLGMAGCVLLAVSLPLAAVAAGAGVLALGAAGRAVRRRAFTVG